MPDELTSAIQHHQRGQLDQAAEIYRRILAAQPDQPEAMHLLGVVAFQQGDAVRAAEWIGRAIGGIRRRRATMPTWPWPIARWAKWIGRSIAAAPRCGCSQTIPRRPTTSAWRLLDQGQAEAAAAQFRAGLAPAAELRHGLQATWAPPCDSRATSPGPWPTIARPCNSTPTWPRRGATSGRCCWSTVRSARPWNTARPRYGSARTWPRPKATLAMCSANWAGWTRPRSATRRPFACNRGRPWSTTTWARHCRKRASWRRPLNWYLRRPGTGPEHGPAALQPGQPPGTAGEILPRPLPATRSPCDSIPTTPRRTTGWAGWGTSWAGTKRPSERYRTAVRLKPDFAAAHCNLGTVREELNDFAEAEYCFREALRHDPQHAGAWSQLATLLGGKLPEGDLAAMRQLLADPELSDGKRGVL